MKEYGLSNRTIRNLDEIEHYGLKNWPRDRIKRIGILIISIEIEEFDYNYGVKKFEQWLSIQRII